MKRSIFYIPEAMIAQCDYIAQCEHRSRADVYREAIRNYIQDFKKAHGITTKVVNMPPDEIPES